MILQIINGFLLMCSGFAIIALAYRLRNPDWNGYGDKTKLLVAAAMMLVVSILIIVAPETADLIRDWTTVTIDIEHMRKGFVVFGAGLSLSLHLLYKPKKNEIENGNN